MTKAGSESPAGFGRLAEDEACRALRSGGYRVLERNYRRRAGEIDAICLDGLVLCFVEVKARSTESAGSPAEAVTHAKRKKIIRLALQYLKEKRSPDVKIRFDVVEVSPGRGRALSCRILKGAFGTE